MRPLVIVIPVCAADEALARQNLGRQKSGRPNLSLIVYPDGFDPGAIVDLAREKFSGAATIRAYPPPDAAWPLTKNVMFKCGAQTVYEMNRLVAGPQPWLWWEPDAVPLVPDWIERIQAEYLACGRLLMGNLLKMGHMDAVAVYPKDLANYSTTALMARAAPFDQAAGQEMSLYAAHSDLFQVRWSRDGKPMSFRSKTDLEAVDPRAVLFHRCKDGSLGDLLEGRTPAILETHGKKAQPCLVQLGRIGDIINILPVAWNLHRQTGERPAVMVARDFAAVLDGCSYLDPVIFDGSFIDLDSAVRRAQSDYQTVLVGQVNGRNLSLTTECDSFSRESWRQLGCLDHWDRLPLVFDNRDRAREQALVRKVLAAVNKPILVNLAGKSSPYPRAKELMAKLRHVFGAKIIDLSLFRAERIHDLIPVLNRAACLVTIDTATTHLAAASRVPVVNLVVDTPTAWHGATPRGNSIWAQRYQEADHESMVAAVTRAFQTYRPPERFIHIYSDYHGEDPESLRRNRIAGLSWALAYSRGEWDPQPVADDDLPVLFPENRARLPHVQDLVEVGARMAQAGPEDVIVLSNTDTAFSPLMSPVLERELASCPALFSHRRDFKRLDGVLTPDQITTGFEYCGADLFVFRLSWWQEHGPKLPDVVLGREWWDYCMMVLIRDHGGREIKNVVYHERHDSYWERTGNRSSLPGQQHNRDLALPFLREHGEKV